MIRKALLIRSSTRRQSVVVQPEQQSSRLRLSKGLKRVSSGQEYYCITDHAAHSVQYMQTMRSSLVAFNLPVCQGEIYVAAWDC